MAESVQDHPWSGYRHNAQGQTDNLVEMHSVYQRPGPVDAGRRIAYSSLFRCAVESEELQRIRLATVTGSVIGNERFRVQQSKK